MMLPTERVCHSYIQKYRQLVQQECYSSIQVDWAGDTAEVIDNILSACQYSTAR